MRIRLFTSRLHAAAEIRAICHVSGLKMAFSVVELILISCSLFKFLVDTCTANVLLPNEIVAACGLSLHGLPGIVISSGGGCYAKGKIYRVS